VEGFEKDFDTWNKLKKRIEKSEKLPRFAERQIWWCSIGVNVGSEVCGKGNAFTRPVLVVKKLSKARFLGVPLSSKIKDSPLHHTFLFKNKNQSLLLSQIRVFDAKRMLNEFGAVQPDDFSTLKKIILKYLS
jgi:mRNA interferase MazF